MKGQPLSSGPKCSQMIVRLTLRVAVGLSLRDTRIKGREMRRGLIAGRSRGVWIGSRGCRRGGRYLLRLLHVTGCRGCSCRCPAADHPADGLLLLLLLLLLQMLQLLEMQRQLLLLHLVLYVLLEHQFLCVNSGRLSLTNLLELLLGLVQLALQLFYPLSLLLDYVVS